MSVGWGEREVGGIEGQRADEVSFRMLESTSGLQIANFRRAGSISALSTDANAHRGGRRGGGRRKAEEGTLSIPFARHRRPGIRMAMGRQRADLRGGPKKFDRYR